MWRRRSRVDARLWNTYDAASKAHFRSHNMLGRGTVKMVDDSKAAQIYQFEGFGGELRHGMQRIGSFGFGAVPLVGASLSTVHQAGHRGFNTAAGVEDGRYRPINHKGGESFGYMVDGAKASDGTGGKLRLLYEGLTGWIHQISGKTITIGQKADADADTTAALALFAKAITVGADGTTTITLTATNIKLAGLVEVTKDLTVDGNLLVHGSISGGKA